MLYIDVKNVIIGTVWGCFPIFAWVMADFAKYIGS